MAQKQLDILDEAEKKVGVMINHQIDRESYIDKQIEMAQTHDFRDTQNPMDPGLGYIFPDLPESQDATGIELGLYDPRQPLSKEDFAIITTTLDAIANRINVLHNEIVQHTGLVLKKLEEMGGKKKKESCYTCGETGHWSPDCPQKKTRETEKKTKDKNPCYKCGELGHWISECPKSDFAEKKGETEKRSKDKDLCYKCGELGHWISDCTKSVEKAEVSGSKSTKKIGFLERSNPEPPTGEPLKKKRKLSRSKKEQ